MTANDMFNNCGLPQFTNKEEFTKEEIKQIRNQIFDFDNYFVNGWKNSETRKNLVNYVNNYCVSCRWYSLIIE